MGVFSRSPVPGKLPPPGGTPPGGVGGLAGWTALASPIRQDQGGQSPGYLAEAVKQTLQSRPLTNEIMVF